MTTDAASARADSIETPYGWAVVAASLAFTSVAFGVTQLLVVGLKPIAHELVWPRSIPSLAYAAILLGSGTGGILMGFWADRVGVHWPARLGAVCLGLGLVIASGLSGPVAMVATFGIVVGVMGLSAAFAPLLTNITRWFDRRRGIAVAVVASGQSVAGAIWPSLFDWGIATHGWRETFWTYGIFATLVLLPLTLVLSRRPPQEVVTAPGPQAAGIRPGAGPGPITDQGRFVLLCLAIVGCCVAMAMPMVHVVAFCTDLGFASADGARMLSLLLACAFVSRIGFGWLSDRLGGLWTIMIGAGLQAIALSLFVMVDSLAGLYLVSGVFGLVFGVIVPAYALALRELFGAEGIGTRMGVIFLFGTIGMAIGGFLGGWIYDLTGLYALAFLTGVGLNIVNLFCIATLLWTTHRGTVAGGPVAAPATG